ncbi:MAG: hypothetical protein IKE60_21050 [Reyranella sp.]|uniref:hypothetical protein n=1 Tax=Reyranella sp. TaxID=1929291 RepID=UPI000958F97E|nr:hypothetical protein [Reyranella sp.]MBN9541281.1 hypothetical protein [Alphaproteobacteria bacterium]MBR2817159.1 hypothetical protein [Reyranella sp.]OJU42706.1 MAG: hypothetical protein BGN99_19900 [Alphaproteobacteria bacterium 65-37]
MTAAAPYFDASPARRLTAFDLLLIVIFLAGLYLGVALQITEKIPLTCAPSGAAGLIMLWRRRDDMQPKHIAGLLGVLALSLAWIFLATDLNYLSKRFTGLVQFTYSLVIGYGFFLTIIRAGRRQFANILLGFCLFIIIGCLLENYGGLRAVSDKVREKIYDAGIVYDADLRDQLLYGRIRPKLFTSEPSAVTFAYTYYCSVWLLVSPWRWKLPVYCGLVGLAMVVLPGPTLVLMLLLAIPYLVLLSGSQRRRSPVRMAGMIALSVILLGVTIVVGQTLFANRLAELARGEDASFFYRFTGPMLVAFDIFRHYPLAGSGLTGETFITDNVMNVYMNSPSFQAAWKIPRIGDVLTNYFWLHWIYLGLIGGVVIIAAISVWLRLLGVPSVLYCWAVWVILGQASGSYVGPKTWAVLLISAGASILSVRASRDHQAPRQWQAARPATSPHRFAI